MFASNAPAVPKKSMLLMTRIKNSCHTSTDTIDRIACEFHGSGSSFGSRTPINSHGPKENPQDKEARKEAGKEERKEAG